MLKSNTIANFIGKSWSGLLGVVLVPVQIHYLGVEAYGLLGFFASLQVIVNLLDMGLSTTANREVSIRLSTAGRAGECRDLVRTLELVYVAEALVIVVAFVLGAEWLSTSWLNTQELSVADVHLVAIVFGLTIALRWPVSLYVGVLHGAERQVLANAIGVLVATLRNLGAITIIALVSPTLLAFTLIQAVAVIIEAVLMGMVAWRIMPEVIGHTDVFSLPLLRTVWRFSASLGVNSLMAAVLKQSDRMLIGNLLTLVEVGYYSAANTLYSGLQLFAFPVASAAFPRFTSLIAKHDDKTLSALFHKTAQVVSFVSAPSAGVLLFFSYDVLLMWTRSEELAASATWTCSILALAGMFNAMMQIPYVLQLAAGITWIALLNNTISVVVLLPLMYILIERFGVMGAGMGWALFNIVYYLTIPHLVHRYVLPREKWRWIFADTLPFMSMSSVLFGIAYWVIQVLQVQHTFLAAGVVALAGGLYVLMCAVIYTSIRSLIYDLSFHNPLFSRLFRRKGLDAVQK